LRLIVVPIEPQSQAASFKGMSPERNAAIVSFFSAKASAEIPNLQTSKLHFKVHKSYPDEQKDRKSRANVLLPAGLELELDHEQLLLPFGVVE
jgi:hypothetical protein